MDWMKNLAEQRIAAAERAGELDNLPGAGKPLPPDKFSSVSPEMRAAVTILSNSGYVPEEVDLMREMNEAREALRCASTDAERAARMRDFCDAELKYNIVIDRHRRVFKDF
jgi:hypothetical protein